MTAVNETGDPLAGRPFWILDSGFWCGKTAGPGRPGRFGPQAASPAGSIDSNICVARRAWRFIA